MDIKRSHVPKRIRILAIGIVKQIQSTNILVIPTQITINPLIHTIVVAKINTIVKALVETKLQVLQESIIKINILLVLY